MIQYFDKLMWDLVDVDGELALLTMLIVIAAIILDAISQFALKNKLASGISTDVPSLISKEARELDRKTYISDIQGISGSPDAVIIENGFKIPVERKPLAKKLRDRYKIQLLVYMRLVEEFEGKRPPYGYLLLGPKSRKIKIINSEQDQLWLSNIIKQMREILNEKQKAVPSPSESKCPRCVVREHCKFVYAKEKA